MASSKLKFMRNSAIYTIGDILPKVLYFFMIPIYTKYMSVQEYGIVNSVLSVGSIFSMLYLLGLDGALMRFYYDYKEEEKQKVFISTLWIYLFIHTLILTSLLLAFGDGFSSLIFKSIPFEPFVKLMLFNCFFSTFTVIPLTIFRMREQSIRFGVFSLLATAVNISFILYFVVFLRQGAEGNLKAYVFTNAVFSIIYLVMIGKNLKLKFSLSILKEGLKYGVPLIPHGIGAWVLNVSDRVFIERYRSLTEVGLYSLGYQFGLLLDYVLGGINKAYVPFFFKTAAENENAPSIFEDVIKYYSVFILSLGLGIALFSKEIILLLASNKQYLEAYKIIPFITMVSVLHGFYYMSVNSVFYVKKTKILAVTTGTSAVINASLNFILVPRYGMNGAIFTTLVAYAFLFVLTYYTGQKYYPIKWHWKTIGINIVLCLALYFCSLIHNSNSIFINIIYKIFIYLIYLALLFAFRLLSLKKLIYYKQIIMKKFRK